MACGACYSTGLVQRPTYWPGMCTSSRSGAATDAKPLRFPECVHAKLGVNPTTTSVCTYKPRRAPSLSLIAFRRRLLTLRSAPVRRRGQALLAAGSVPADTQRVKESPGRAGALELRNV